MDHLHSLLNQAPLVKTKLYIPKPRPGLVLRPLLIERLSAGSGRKLTLVSAPAGFGKTTLLSEWIAHSKVPVAWVSLDQEDNDVARFITYLVAALQTIEPDVGMAALAMLQPPQAIQLNTALTTLLNEIAGIPDQLVLVLDDYHLIRTQPVHDALTFLLDHLPPQIHIVISTRVDPPLSIARMRARGEMIELRQTDLRFTREETIEFLNQVMDLKLTADDIATLASRTEGWVAGLQMAAVSMKGRADIRHFIAEFSGSQHHVLDYLIEEVLERQPEHVQAFLLQTSILDRMTGSLCDSVIDPRPSIVGSSQAMLEHLEHANLFVVPIDDNQRWYRYHHLFADSLRSRLQQTQPAMMAELHRRASEWCEQKGLIYESIDHALSAGEFERAANLVSRQAEALWARGEIGTLSRWLETLPDELVSSWPELTIHHAIVLFMAGRLGETEQHLQMAERALSSASTESTRRRDKKLKGMIAMVRAYTGLFRGDPRAMAQFSQEALELLPEGNSMWRSGAETILGDAYSWSGDIASAIHHYRQAIAINQAIGNVYYALMAAAKIATNEMQQGQLHRAAQTCQEGLQLAQANGLGETGRAGVLMVILGQVLCEWNDLERANECTQKGAALCEQEGNVVMLGFSYVGLAHVRIFSNDLAGIEEILLKLEKLGQKSHVPPWIIASANGWQAHALLRQNKLDAAAQVLQKRRLSKKDDAILMHIKEDIALARLLVAQGKNFEALELLEQLAQISQTHGRSAWVIEILAVRSLIFQALGDTHQAIESLKQALAIAEPEGYVRLFVDEGEPMQSLLRTASSHGVESEYVTKLLDAFEVEEKKKERKIGEEQSLSAEPAQTTQLAELLSEREREVLRLLATDLSSTEIAQKLFVSMNTVRSHIKNIYSKLNVHSRYEAIEHARKLELI
ncbi:MAG: tetratricopeptide repeat protein [Chloroflexi bacterium]|nr:tetratricopeptide repeat protein [Chloroflexota bacterium]